MRKKILVLINNDVGMYKTKKEIVEALVDDYEVYLSLPNGPYIEEFEKKGCHFIDTEIERRGKNPITDMKLFLKYKTMMKKIEPMCVLTYTIKPNIYGALAARLQRIPILMNVTGLGSGMENRGIFQKFISGLYISSVKKSAVVFFQNSRNQEYFLKRISNMKNNVLIPGSGVNLKEHQALAFKDDQNIDFGFVGRVMKEKGIDELLEAAQELKKQNYKVDFHIAGFFDENYQDKLENLEVAGIIKYHGLVDDIDDFFEKMDCVVLPSYSEGMANAILEAAACAKPVIASDIAGCKEAIDDGKTGFLCEARDADSLKECMVKFTKLTTEERKQFGQQARAKMEKYFDRQIVVNKYLEKIDEIKQI